MILAGFFSKRISNFPSRELSVPSCLTCSVYVQGLRVHEFMHAQRGLVPRFAMLCGPSWIAWPFDVSECMLRL